MAVILREQVALRGKTSEIKTFHPSGALSKTDRERAENLDAFLEREIPKVVERIINQVTLAKNDTSLFRWYLFGKELRKITDNELVLSLDVKSGIIWEAVWQHLPNSFKPHGTRTEKNLFSKKRVQGRDHLSICYTLGQYDEKDILWIRRWDDWCQIYYRTGILEDKRVFESLREEIQKLNEYPKKDIFRGIVSNISQCFPQKAGKKVHTSVLAKTVIRKRVHDSAMQAYK